jgi:hypothetical protein
MSNLGNAYLRGRITSKYLMEEMREPTVLGAEILLHLRTLAS